MVPVVAKVAEVQKGEGVADCWGEVVEVASCPLEVGADLQENQRVKHFCSLFHNMIILFYILIWLSCQSDLD